MYLTVSTQCGWRRAEGSGRRERAQMHAPRLHTGRVWRVRKRSGGRDIAPEVGPVLVENG